MIHKALNIRSNCQRNKVTILNLIRMNPGISRSEISEVLDLTPPTITEIVRNLKEQDFIAEEGLSKAKRGRKPIRLKLKGGKHFFLSIEIETRFLRAAVLDWNSEILALEESTTTKYEDPFFQIESVYELAEKAVKEAGLSWENIEAVACGTSQSINPADGVVFFSANKMGWNNLNLHEKLQQRFGKPCYVEDRTPLRTLAEKYYGKAKDEANFIYLGVGSGIALGIVIGGSLYRGERGGSGEIGHIPLVGNDLRCMCGNSGCLETVASVPRIVEAVNRDLGIGVQSLLQGENKGDTNGISIDDIVRVAREGDRLVINIIREIGEKIGRVLAASVTVLNPGLIVIGGPSGLGELLKDPILVALETQTLPQIFDSIRLEVSELPIERASLIGGLILIAERHWNEPD